MTQTTSNQADSVRVGIAYLSFIVLGMPGAMLGVAWSPSIRSTFNLSLDAVGALLVATMGSYFVASFISGRLVARVGFGTLLVASSFVTAVGLIGYVLSPAWAIMVAFGVLVGGGAGVIDAGMNIYFAANFGPRLMNWLHASFGIGATISPLLMTGILNGGGVWRTGYLVLAVAFGAIGVLFGLTRARWNDSMLASASPESTHSGISARQTLALPLTWIGIGLFLAYGGQETTPGQWSYSLFADARAVTASVAGLWVSIYWASFTIGRIVFGIIVSWLSARTLLNICAAGSVVGALLFWWRPVELVGFSTLGVNFVLDNPSNLIGFIGLALFGFMLAPMFALLITSTQERLGPLHAPNAIGFQVAAASIGGGLIPGIAGRLAVDHGLEIVPVFLLFLTVISVVLYLGSTSPALSTAMQPVPVGD